MRYAPRSVIVPVVLATGLWWTPPVHGQQPTKPPFAVVPLPVDPGATAPCTIAEVLVIGSTGASGRAVIVPDALGPSLIDGTWMPPTAGDEVRLPNGTTKSWKAARIDEKGNLKDPALRGGYAYVAVDAVEGGAFILDARGHSMVYVNGEPRVGDPYANGYVRIPIALKKGRNHLLFRGGRGEEMRAVIRVVMVPFEFDLSDATLPDLVEGQGGSMLGAVVLTNATDQWQRGWVLAADVPGGPPTRTAVDQIPPWSCRKVGFEFQAPASAAAGKPRLNLGLARADAANVPPSICAVTALGLRKPTETRKITFRSGIDGSVQYYVLRPALTQSGDLTGLPLILTLHGASVEATNQANAYRGKDWCNIVAATNRRPFGFDWEDWGRVDAMEVLEHASAMLKPDPRRVYLTGHSMGGHGTWQIGAQFPGRFAAIAPSAGWISFWSYTGAAAYDAGSPIENILRRAVSPSDTLALKRNYLQYGVYVLHGDADDNVPVEQAREMRSVLGGFHTDFAYYERPGAGHWWGDACVDWPPLMEFLKSHSRPEGRDVREVEFVTASPTVSADSDWVTIEAQAEQLKPSSVDLKLDPAKRVFRGTTENVARLSLDVSSLAAPYFVEVEGKQVQRWALEPGQPIRVELDKQAALEVPWPASDLRVWLSLADGAWGSIPKPPSTLKGPGRAGLFKSAFGNNVLLVVGTAGTREETEWALAKARYDAETFWYRGNGSPQIVLDTEFEPGREPDRNVILYGNAYSNRAWKALFGDSPVQVAEGGITIGSKRMIGESLGCLLIRPRPGSDRACVGAVTGTGVAGMQLASRVPYFVSGVGLPDWTVIGPEAMTKGVGGIRAAGFFGNDWGLSDRDSAWAEAATEKPADPAP